MSGWCGSPRLSVSPVALSPQKLRPLPKAQLLLLLLLLWLTLPLLSLVLLHRHSPLSPPPPFVSCCPFDSMRQCRWWWQLRQWRKLEELENSRKKEKEGEHQCPKQQRGEGDGEEEHRCPMKQQ